MLKREIPKRDVKFHVFGERKLSELLELEVLPFAGGEQPFKQLDYVEEYVKELIAKYAAAGRAGGAAVAIEAHYVDRDYIEDHSVFYSRNLFCYENWCRRLHFFSLPQPEVEEKFRSALAAGRNSIERYRAVCREISKECYLGFCVIKPLGGCPVGRTVLRVYPAQEPGESYTRDFRCIRDYKAHLLGVELTVEGLAFQQQDTGVAACATTAIWSSLHHLRSFEDVATATPAQITSLASQYNLPFGRPMPSEGLSIGQMCQAIQAIGVSPSVIKLEDYPTARFYIHAAARSGMAPILAIARPGMRHAVTVAGIKLQDNPTFIFTEELADASAALESVYVHDDRCGPYLKGKLIELKVDEMGGGEPKRRPGVELGRLAKEKWEITHILLAVHPKIRLSFKGLRDAGFKFGIYAKSMMQAFFRKPAPQNIMECRVVRGYRYIEDLISASSQDTTHLIEEFARTVAMPRYVGLVRLSSPVLGAIDLLIDTTGTPRNLHAIAVVASGPPTEYTQRAAQFLATRFQTVAFG